MKKHKLDLIKIHQSTVKELFDHFASLSTHAIRGEDFILVPGSTRMPCWLLTPTLCTGNSQR